MSKGSLIDNILTNSTDNFLSSGVLESRVSHHHPVFCCFNSCNGVPKQPDTPTPPHYDYCQTNISKFLDDVNNGITVQEFIYDEEGFKIVSSKLDELIDQNFKIDACTVTSKRNRLFNPWITSGIIASVHTKTFLYKNWKKSCTDSNPLGCNESHLKYKDYRRLLCKLIKNAKKSYYSKKFNLSSGNIKKTWEENLRVNLRHRL